MTIVLDQSLAVLAEHLTGFSVCVRQGNFMTVPDIAVSELRDTLYRQGQSGPYIIVGASFAGLTALLYAYKFPHEVGGLVLVDSTHPRQSEVALAALPSGLPDNPEITAFRDLVKGFGPAWDYSRRLFADLGSLGNIPLIVLAAGEPTMPKSLPEAIRQKLTVDWHDLQRDHACRSSWGEMRVVPRSGHEIAKDAPEAVIAAIKDIIERMAKPPNP